VVNPAIHQPGFDFLENSGLCLIVFSLPRVTEVLVERDCI